MINKDYQEAFAEVIEILNNTNKADVEKIPPKFMEYLRENASNGSNFKFDSSADLKDVDLKPKTKAILAIIYKKYWCNEVQAKQFEETLCENQKRLDEERKQMMRISFNRYDLFPQKDNLKKQDETQVIVTNKESRIVKFFNKIKSLLFKK